MAKKKNKIILKKSEKLTVDEVLHILVSRYLRVQNAKIPEKREIPKVETQVYHSITDYNKDMRAVNLARNFNNRIQNQKDKQKTLLKKIERSIISFLPKYRWFVVDVRDGHCAVGISTSDWGGGESHLWIKEYFPGHLNSQLHELKHLVT
jgi:hypothetical protein